MMIQIYFVIFFFKSQSLEKSVYNMKTRCQKRNPKEAKTVQKPIEIFKNNSEVASMEGKAKCRRQASGQGGLRH